MRQKGATAGEAKVSTRKPPPFGRYKSPPPTIWTKWDVNSIELALNEHELGSFRTSALLAEWLRRDPRVFTTLENLVQAALGLDYSTRPSADTTNSKLAERLAKRVHSWWFRCIPESTLATLIRNYILLGFAVGEVLWGNVGTQEEPEWRPTGLRVHPAQYLRWDTLKECFMLAVVDGPGVQRGEIPITPGDGRWLLFASSIDRPWMNGAIRPLGLLAYLRRTTNRDWARRSETESIGIKLAKVPRGANAKDVDAFLRNLAKLGDETTLKLPEGYDFDLKAVDAGAAEGFRKLIENCDTAITLVLLGQNLTTQIEGGSFAAAQTHAKMQLDRLEAIVAGLSTSCRSDVLIPWGRFNVEGFADEAAPWNHWDPTPPDDKQKRAQAYLTLSQALPTLIAAGIDITPVVEVFDLQFRDGVVPGALPTPPPAVSPTPAAPVPAPEGA